MSIVRDITVVAKKYFQDDEILLFVGARQAGKTTVLRQLEEEVRTVLGAPAHFLNLEDPEYRILLNASPKNLFKLFTFDLQRRTFLFIDEVQYLNDPANVLKYLYDEYHGRIKILTSGSSAFYLDEKFKDSLAGRKRILPVRTLSFKEFLRFKHEPALEERLEGALSIDERTRVRQHFEEYMLYGGYPRVVFAPLEEKRELLKELAYSYAKKDIFEAHVRQEEVFYKLMKILASQAGQLLNVSELASTLEVSKTMIQKYLTVMQKSFHLALIQPFYKNMRKELTKMPKVFFMDLGLRNFFVDKFTTFMVRDDRGALLENATFRQLLEAYGVEEIRFWRTIGKHEVDFVVREEAAFEVKTNPRAVNVRPLKVFMAQYPAIPLTIISFDYEATTVGPFPVREVWEVETACNVSVNYQSS